MVSQLLTVRPQTGWRETTRVGENHHSRRGLLAVSALNPAPGCLPLPAGSMVTFSLLLPRPAEVTAATHSRYCCPRFRWAIR